MDAPSQAVRDDDIIAVQRAVRPPVAPVSDEDLAHWLDAELAAAPRAAAPQTLAPQQAPPASVVYAADQSAASTPCALSCGCCFSKVIPSDASSRQAAQHAARVAQQYRLEQRLKWLRQHERPPRPDDSAYAPPPPAAPSVNEEDEAQSLAEEAREELAGLCDGGHVQAVLMEVGGTDTDAGWLCTVGMEHMLAASITRVAVVRRVSPGAPAWQQPHPMLPSGTLELTLAVTRLPGSEADVRMCREDIAGIMARAADHRRLGLKRASSLAGHDRMVPMGFRPPMGNSSMVMGPHTAGGEVDEVLEAMGARVARNQHRLVHRVFFAQSRITEDIMLDSMLLPGTPYNKVVVSEASPQRGDSFANLGHCDDQDAGGLAPVLYYLQGRDSPQVQTQVVALPGANKVDARSGALCFHDYGVGVVAGDRVLIMMDSRRILHQTALLPADDMREYARLGVALVANGPTARYSRRWTRQAIAKAQAEKTLLQRD